MLVGRARSLAVAFAIAGSSSACIGDEPPPGDPVLRDSLGLPEDAPVVSVRMTFQGRSEVADPDVIEIQSGYWVDFLSADGRPRTVAFELDSVSPAARTFLEIRGGGASPPLLGSGIHWVMDFSEAPPGRYPYRVRGTGEPGRGAVVVTLPPER